MEKENKKEGKEYDFIIIGAGVAGLSAAMYGARLGMKVLVLGATSGSELPVGGIITTTNFIENYPSIEKISGAELADNFKKHALSYDLVTIKEEKTNSVEKDGQGFIVKTGERSYKGKSVLFATGTIWKRLDVPGSKEFENRGVAYCAMCDAPLFKNKTVAVIGGSNSAVKYAVILAAYAKKVYIIYRKEKIRADAANLKKIEGNKKVEIINNTNVTKIIGDKIVRAVVLDKKHEGSDELKLDGVFVAIGYIPSSDLAAKLGVKINDSMEIMINHNSCETSMKGVFAAGDVTDGIFKQVIAAADGGCRAAFSAHGYISKGD
jgi:thioredoxin-disulfide reductase